MSTMIRVLVVTDDGLANGGFLQWTEQDAAVASVEGKTREFHLGEFMRVLQETAWIGFNVEFTKAHRDGGGQLPDAAEAFRADRGADVINFRFDKPFEFKGAERRLSDYDIVLFFPVRVGNANTVYAAEAEAIATFMESGGGFFATGDHEDFGASISGLIPRVRSMRRWYFTGTGQNQSPPGPNGEPPAPPALNPHRHDTTRPGVDGVSNFEDQSDEIAQEITPTLYPAGITVVNGYAGLRYLPHPLLCSPGGVVRYLPDHMHEGSCEVPDKLAERTFKLGAATLREYPDYAPPGVPADYVAQPLAPEIVATSQVLPGVRTPALDAEDHTGGDLAAAGTRFGAIAAWDGHRVGRGRVVVDATWHHFFNINLTGDRYLERASVHLPASQQQKLHGFYVPDGNGGRRPCAEYELIMWYYRNLVYWLIPARRAASVWWQSVIDLTGRSRLAEELASIVRGKSPPTLADYLYLGALAQSYFASARGACATATVHPQIFQSKIPWFEWIQQVVDPWDPAKRRAGSRADGRASLLGALGMAPRADVAVTLTMGAALHAVARSRWQTPEGLEAARLPEAVQKLWPDVLEHAIRTYTEELAAGMTVAKALHARTMRMAGGGAGTLQEA